MTDELPIATTHKGVAIFAGQPAKRVALIRREIDKVSKISDLEELFRLAGDCSWSAEARIYSAARCIGGIGRATERREPKPDINREDVEAATAGLSVVQWAHPDRYCSLLDMDHERAAPREELLDEE